jgi:hypothetical protein
MGVTFVSNNYARINLNVIGKRILDSESVKAGQQILFSINSRQYVLNVTQINSYDSIEISVHEYKKPTAKKALR